MKCARCGTMNSEGMRFCGNCGTPLQTPQRIVTAPSVPLKKRNDVYIWGVPVPSWLGLAIVLLFVCVLCTCMLVSGVGSLRTPTPSALGDNSFPRVQTAMALVYEPTSTNSIPTATIVSPTPANYGVGDVIAKGNWEYTVTKTEKMKTLVWSTYGNKTDAKGIFLVVYMTLKNIGKSNFSINYWDFKLRDANAIEYSTSDASGIYSYYDFKKLSALGSQFVPGLPANTALVFDINPSAQGLTLYLAQAKVSVELGQ